MTRDFWSRLDLWLFNKVWVSITRRRQRLNVYGNRHMSRVSILLPDWSKEIYFDLRTNLRRLEFHGIRYEDSVRGLVSDV